MNLETLTSIVGPINRGQLDSGFDSDCPSTVDHSARRPINYDTSRVAKPPKVKLNIKPKPMTEAQRMARLRSLEPHMRRLYESLFRRGITRIQLADMCDCTANALTQCINGYRIYPEVRAKLMTILTKEERKELRWI